jgi:hypothetical protein
MRVRFDSIVRTVTDSSAAASLFDRPDAMTSATRVSVGVKPADAERPAIRFSSASVRATHRR